ncbi:aminotransferase-like domain-containing protein [Mycolicibacterium brisbanense]|uniref:Putative GntR family transcriptional regulator n=1 Tax=Mycolicibacterium brisbanense TaxID=146020 RepID=A0A100VXL1_9MYCO|nr:PLP-dependent aminotransferase family protein [Mycolicibacterium brisbanense]MCV7161324.1 PLP-dependent aminotransferase family protein [Mycolicibacterium brisbanense]GAS87886.1 putative GntR family transcriptional regulator [Mycolicibacterium brisbanense]
MPRHTRLVHLPLDTSDLTAKSIATQTVALIAGGQLADGDWLPSTRALADELGCSRTMVAAAYDELVAAGFLEGVPGSGTRTTSGAAAAAAAGLSSRPSEHAGVDSSRRPAASKYRAHQRNPTVDLRPGYPDTGLIDMRAWTRAWRAAGARTPTVSSPWQDASESFVAALTDHLRTNRGIDTDTVLDVPGSGAAFHAVAAVSGLTRCYVESPCYPAAYEEFLRAGLHPVFVPVDDDGLRVDQLGDAAGLVYCTPAHQYPLGHRLSVNRRAELVAWAKRTGSIIVEDDYDGEFRYGVAPLPAVRSVPGAGEHVAYIGTASKILTPGLGAAWLVPPRPLRDAVLAYLREHRLALPVTTRDALAELILTGDLQRHLARAAREYRHRRDILIAALGTHCPELSVLGVEAGLHVAVVLPRAHDDRHVAEQLSTHGFVVEPLSLYPGAVDGQINGLAVGFALIDRVSANGFAIRLAEALG